MDAIKAQWDEVTRCRERIDAADDDSELAQLDESWRALEAEGLVPASARNFDDPHIKTESVLLHAIGCLYMGHYPPPEIMLAISETFDRYMAASGRLTLEEVFFGKPRPKAGNFARRFDAMTHRTFLAFDVANGMEAGLTKIRAAELAGIQNGSRIDAASIARMVKLKGMDRKK